MEFRELDETTRKHMLREFLNEESGDPYRGKNLSAIGIKEYPNLMRIAIENGNEDTLYNNLKDPKHWTLQKGAANPDASAKRLAITEFNTWYVRGLAAKLLEEGIDKCRVYRAEHVVNPRKECTEYENMVVYVQEIYDGHRIRYRRKNADRTALSIPSGPNCRHTIERIEE